MTDEMLEFLAELRRSGRVNMFGSPSILQEEFGLSRREARETFIYWMQTFSGDNDDQDGDDEDS